MGEPVRVALKIAYDGRSFYGHQRQPVHRTVEGECLKALRAAGILGGPTEGWFRSASRTDRGVSAIGNVIGFESALAPRAAIGAFNDRARDVWAWAVAAVPEGFHPRHAVERWYRYHLLADLDILRLEAAAREFVGTHDFRSFTSDPPVGPFSVARLDVAKGDGVITVDVRARSFRRGMVRRIVAALVAHANEEASLLEIRRALAGERHDFGMAPAEPLVLMDVRYDVPFEVVLKPKVLDEWRRRSRAALLETEWLEAFRAASLAPVDRP